MIEHYPNPPPYSVYAIKVPGTRFSLGYLLDKGMHPVALTNLYAAAAAEVAAKDTKQ